MDLNILYFVQKCTIWSLSKKENTYIFICDWLNFKNFENYNIKKKLKSEK